MNPINAGQGDALQRMQEASDRSIAMQQKQSELGMQQAEASAQAAATNSIAKASA